MKYTGTRGTVYFDDFDSRRFSEIGLLPDPGIQNPTPDPIPGWNNVSYTYGDPDHVHAVTGLSNGSTYQYDSNGNQTCRYENSKYYKQEYNAENRLYQVTQRSGSCSGTVLATWVFSYDADGTRVKQVYTDATSTLTTYYFFGGAYEVQDDGSTETILKYYSFAGGMVAMQDGTSLNYFLTDHLSSVIAVLDASGNLLSEQRYLPFGQVRDDVGTITQTDYSFTGQRALDAQGNQYDLGLMDYRARFYSPYLNHFTQPDSIIPQPGNPQSLNRYSYVLNSPLKFTDPSGHVFCDEFGTCHEKGQTYQGENSYFYFNSGEDSNGSGEDDDKTWLPPFETGIAVTNGFHWEDPDHDGEDARSLAYEKDKDIQASANGRIVLNDANSSTDWNEGYGNVLIVEYTYEVLPQNVILNITEKVKGFGPGKSLYVLYAHLENPSSFGTGVPFNAGDILGIEGKTGNSPDGIHLHIETRIFGSGFIVPGYSKADPSLAQTFMDISWAWQNSFRAIDPKVVWSFGTKP